MVLQTKSPLGVQNAEEIYRLPGCDAIFIGPTDLRFTMRSPDGRFPTPEEHEEMIQQVIRLGRRLRMPTGVHCGGPEEALSRVEQGMQFLALGSDLGMLRRRPRRRSRASRAEDRRP